MINIFDITDAVHMWIGIDFIRNFVEFHSHEDGVMKLYFYFASVFWIYIFFCTLLVVWMIYIGSKHHRRMNKVKKKRYDKVLAQFTQSQLNN